MFRFLKIQLIGLVLFSATIFCSDRRPQAIFTNVPDSPSRVTLTFGPGRGSHYAGAGHGSPVGQLTSAHLQQRRQDLYRFPQNFAEFQQLITNERLEPTLTLRGLTEIADAHYRLFEDYTSKLTRATSEGDSAFIRKQIALHKQCLEYCQKLIEQMKAVVRESRNGYAKSLIALKNDRDSLCAELIKIKKDGQPKILLLKDAQKKMLALEKVEPGRKIIKQAIKLQQEIIALDKDVRIIEAKITHVQQLIKAYDDHVQKRVEDLKKVYQGMQLSERDTLLRDLAASTIDVGNNIARSVPYHQISAEGKAFVDKCGLTEVFDTFTGTTFEQHLVLESTQAINEAVAFSKVCPDPIVQDYIEATVRAAGETITSIRNQHSYSTIIAQADLTQVLLGSVKVVSEFSKGLAEGYAGGSVAGKVINFLLKSTVGSVMIGAQVAADVLSVGSKEIHEFNALSAAEKARTSGRYIGALYSQSNSGGAAAGRLLEKLAAILKRESAVLQETSAIDATVTIRHGVPVPPAQLQQVDALIKAGKLANKDDVVRFIYRSNAPLLSAIEESEVIAQKNKIPATGAATASAEPAASPATRGATLIAQDPEIKAAQAATAAREGTAASAAAPMNVGAGPGPGINPNYQRTLAQRTAQKAETDGAAALNAEASAGAEAGVQVRWGHWEDLNKVVINDREYALINGRPYTRHAIERMRPKGSEIEWGGDKAREIPTMVVENAIAHGRITETRIVNGAERISKTIDQITVVLEKDIVITVWYES